MTSSTTRAFMAKKQSTSFTQVATNLLNVLQGYSKTIRLLLVMLLTLTVTTNAWAEEVTYVFTSKDWAAKIGSTAANWKNNKAGAGFSNNGIQVTTNATGANGTSPISYNNISQIVVTYNTNKSKGNGTLSIKIGDNAVTTNNWQYSGNADGTSANFTSTFDYSSPQSGKVTLTANTTTNSIYIVSIKIVTSAGSGSTPDPCTTPAVAWNTKPANGEVGGSMTASVTTNYSNGLTYSSSNQTVATVTNAGVINYLSAGTTTITATVTGDGTTICEGPVSVQQEITVTAPAGGGGDGECIWELVTDASSLAAGDEIVIAAKDYNYALSTTQNNNNRGQAAITKSGSTISEPSNSVQILTLEAGNKSNTFAFYDDVNSGYLYAASSGSNYLKTETKLSDNSSWTVSIDGTATIKANGTNSRNVMQYNQSSSLFACYSSASQKALVIYKKVCTSSAPTTYAVTYDENGADSGSVPIDAKSPYEANASVTVLGNTGNLAKTGYTFNGWNTQANGQGTAYSAGSTFDITEDITLYAQWKAVSYTITYELDGGTNHASNPANYTIETATITLQNPTKTGYTFSGWYKESTFTNKLTQITNGSTGNLTLYAKWTANKYTITYTDQGDVAFSGTHESGYPTQHTYGTATTLKSATKSGYNFLGWFTTANCSGSAITQLGATEYTGNITLYAKWEVAIITYTITWSINEETTSETYEQGATIEFPAVTPCDGMDLVGWTEIENYANETTAPSDLLITATAEKTTTYYAVFAKLVEDSSAPYQLVEADRADWSGKYLIAYNDQTFADGRIGGKTADGSIGETGHNIDLSSYIDGNNIPSENGDPYHLNLVSCEGGGYLLQTQDGKYNYYSSNATGLNANTKKDTAEPYKLNVIFNNSNDIQLALSGDAAGSVFHHNPSDQIFQFYKNASMSPVYLYRQNEVYRDYSTRCKYTVTFDANGHGEAPESQVVYKNELATEPDEDPQDEGYNFQGWYDNQQCTGNAYDFATPITDNITLYAKWTPCVYTITYKDQGNATFSGSHESGNPTQHTYGTATTLKGATKTGYTFGGWYKEAACTNKVTSLGATEYTANITLYAKWTVNSYTVTWNPNGGNWGGSTDSKKDTYNYGATITKPGDPTRDGYRFDGWGDVAGTMPANNLEYTAQWTPVYTITWSAAGEETTTTVTQGDAVVLPDTPTSCSDEYTTFVGWFTDAAGIETNPSNDLPGTQVTASTIPTGNTTYYAVWADGSGNTSTVDELTRETTGVSGTSYTSWSDKTASSSAVYAGQSAGGNDAIQLRSNNSNSGIITTTSGGKATKVSVTWNTNTADSRTLNVYGKNTAYSSPTDLYGDTAGTLIGTIVKGSSTELTISGDYEYIGLRSASGAMYLDEIQITWSSGVDPTGYISSCCQSKAVVTVTPQATELTLNIDGTASTNVNISQEGAGSGRYHQPIISPAEGASLNWEGEYKKNAYDLTFIATQIGTYTITADFTETAAACPRYGTATINVVANPILVVSEPTISSQCGTASVPVAVTIDSRYLTGSSLTAQIATAGNGTFEICKTQDGTFATTNLTEIAAGQDEKASETIYVRYVADVDDITPAVGTLTISDSTTTKIVTLNTTPTCGTSIRMTASDANSIRVTTANGQWTRTQTPIQLRGAYLLQNLEAGQGAKVVLSSSNSNFKFVKPDVQSAGTATFESEKITTETWEQNIHLVYTPATYNANDTTTIIAKVITFGGNTEHASSTMEAYGRSFPETFVLALNTGDGWVALPADMTAPYGTSCNTGVGTHDPYPITVDDEANPTAATLAPARAVYKGAARNTPMTNPWTIQLESNKLTGYYLFGSNKANNTISNSDQATGEGIKWALSTSDNIIYRLSQATVTEGQKLGYNATAKHMGQYKSSASNYKYDFRVLPVEGTTCTYFITPELTLVSFDNNYITYTTPYDGTLNYKISADGGNTWTELTGVLDCKTLSFTLPVATYRGKTIVVKPNAAEEDCITVSDPIVIPNPSIDRGETPWRYTGVVGKPFSDNSKSITINDLQNALNVEIIQQVTNSNISASITPEGVVTVSMDAADATEGEHKAVLEFTSAGAEAKQVGVVITIKSLATQEFDGGNEYLFTESTPIVLCHNEMISLGETPTVYLSYPLYMNGSLITELGQFNQTSLTLTDLTSGTSMAAVSREMNGNGVVKLTFGNSITNDLIVGHMYRLSWENTNQVMTDQIGLPYTDCVMDFVFSENCDAPTALQACPVTNSGFTANWAPVQDCDGNVTVEVYTKGEVATLLDKTSFSTTEVKALSANFTNENWVTNKNNTTTGGPTISSNRLLISDVSTPTYYNLFSPPLSNFGSFDESTTYTITITLYQATNDAGAGAYFYVMDNGSDLKKSTIPTITDKTVLIDEQSVTSKTLTNGTTTFTVQGLSKDDRIRLLGFESGSIATEKKNVYISSIKIEGPGAGDVVATKNVSCAAGSVEITSLDANTQYYYTVSDGANTSREIAVKTYNNDPQVKFYDDENKTKELVETVVVDGKTTTVFVTGQNISGCESDDVVAYASSGYRVNSSALVYDPKTATISGSIELTLTDPTITSGTLTIRDGVSQTYSLPIVSGSNIDLQVVEWKAGSAVVMYNGDPAQTASVTINGSPAGSTQVKAAEKDVAVYELPVTGLSTSANKHLVITIGANKAILTIPQVVTGTTSVISPNSDLVIVKDGIFQVSGDLTLNNVTIYGGGTLLVPNGQTVNVNTLTMRVGAVENGDYKNLYPQLQLKGTLTNTSGQINLDYLTTNEFYYPLSVPYAVNIADIQYPVDIYGANVKSDNTGSFQFKYYDGAERAAGRTGWIVLDETTNTTLNPNTGYAIWGIPKKVKVNGGTSTRQKFGIHRLPLVQTAANMMTSETSSHLTTVNVYNGSKRDSDNGWNYLGNPFLSHYGNFTTADNVMKLGKLVWDEAQGAWVVTDEYQRYVVFTNDCQNYTAELASTTAIPAFSAFFIQADQGGAINFALPNVAAVQSIAARRSAEEDKEITTGIILSGEKHSDRTGLLIADQFTEAYEFNADLSKFDNQDMNLYTIAPSGKLAFMAINEELAKQTIPLGYSVSEDGMYTIAFDEQRYNRNDIYALYLIDYDRNETTNLLHMDYDFYSETGANAERFALQVAFAPSTTTDVEYTQVGDILVSREGNTLLLDNLPSDATVTIYDAVGHLIEQHTATQLLQLTLQKGYYLLHIGNNQHSVVMDTFIP